MCTADQEHIAGLDRMIEKLEAENERLRNRLKIRIDTVEGLPTGNGEDEIDRLEQENKRLKDKLKRAENALKEPNGKT
jgi:uncharacterized protein YdcH (DUF465 family)